MLTLIALALIILACSFKKSMADSLSENDVEDENLAKPASYGMELEMEPRIVVIMAGDEVPTFLLEKS